MKSKLAKIAKKFTKGRSYSRSKKIGYVKSLQLGLMLAFLIFIVSSGVKNLYYFSFPFDNFSHKLLYFINSVGLSRFSSFIINNLPSEKFLELFSLIAGNNLLYEGADVGSKENDNKIVILKLAIISDVHEDIENLQKALEKAKSLNVDRLIFLGDLTDYGDVESLKKIKNIIDSYSLSYNLLPGDHDIAQTRDETNFVGVFGSNYTLLSAICKGCGPNKSLNNYMTNYGNNVQILFKESVDYWSNDDCLNNNDCVVVRFMLFDNSKNFSTLGENKIQWFNSNIQDADILFLSQPLATKSMNRVMGIIDGVKDELVFSENLKLLSSVRKSDVRVIIAGDLHQFSYFQDPEKDGLMHYTAGALLKSQSLEKFNPQGPRIMLLYIFEDKSYSIIDTPIE